MALKLHIANFTLNKDDNTYSHTDLIMGNLFILNNVNITWKINKLSKANIFYQTIEHMISLNLFNMITVTFTDIMHPILCIHLIGNNNALLSL